MKPKLSFQIACTLLCSGLVNIESALAEDWPMWRHDAQRTAATDQELASQLHLQWVHEYPQLTTAWPDQPKMLFDKAYEPVVMGRTMFVGSSRNDTVTALDTRTGRQRWTFYADGPIRFAPVAWEGRIYFVSDDGYLYCLHAGTGRLVWKFRGGPSDRKVLGNKRLISTWPARGAPVVADGIVYFAASIWPYMGIFIHALDAQTGEVVWTNDGDGSMYIKQPHNSDSFAGVAPQGALVVVGDKLLIPGGRSVPACYDRRTGKMLYYRLAENSKRGGGSDVAAMGDLLFNGGAAFQLATGKYLGDFGKQLALTDRGVYGHSGGEFRALDPGSSQVELVEEVDRRGRKREVAKWSIAQIGTAGGPEPDALIKAGERLYVGSPNRIFAIELPWGTEGSLDISWETEIEGTPVSLLAADDRLFAVTLEGGIYCFAAQQTNPKVYRSTKAAPAPADEWTVKARTILRQSGVLDGYCIAWGVGTGRLIGELARQSNLHIIAVDPNEEKVLAARKELIALGLYGERVVVHAGNPLTFPLPPYLASLMVSEDLAAAGIEPREEFVRKAFYSLRPFGGVACLPLAQGQRAGFVRLVEQCDLARARVRQSAELLLLSRDGPLPGSGNWTHEHADAANTRVSRDRLVKAPLGLLWFGGSSHHRILPRHGHGPQPQVIDGRLVIEGMDMLRAIDIYTGRVLWEADLPGVGEFYNNTSHQPGANATGTNFISTSDGIYVAYRDVCVRLDPQTGEKIAEFRLPASTYAEQTPRWGYINVQGDHLVGSTNLLVVELDENARPKPGKNENLSSSKQLVVMDRHSGRVRWTVNAVNGFRHNAICMGGGRLYAIDLLSQGELDRLRRRGETAKSKSRLVVFDLKTGEEIWNADEGVFGTWLSYSERLDVLVEAGRVAGDSLQDEPEGMRAYRAGDGTVLWYRGSYSGPAMIHGDRILNEGEGYDLLTGEPIMREDPITGRLVTWSWSRNYGCNTPMVSECLLTFRSGAAGYYDLANDGGTGNFGGFRSSCTNNLIVAGGLLTAPDYTRTCVCGYQNQTSLALVHMPDAEIWTTFPVEGEENLKHIGINLGAPGDRRAPGGRLWLNEFQDLNVEYDEGLGYYNGHSSKIESSPGGLPWVVASGCHGITRLELDPKLDPEREGSVSYTVRLHFADPDNDRPGQRLFDVSIQGEIALSAFDIVKESGGRNRAVVKEFQGVQLDDKLLLKFASGAGPEATAATAPLLCGLEVVREEPASGSD